MDTFAKRLVWAREQRGLNKSQLSALLGMSTQAIWNYENRPNGGGSSETIFKLADALGVSPRWLAIGEGLADAPDKVLPPPELANQALACLEAYSKATHILPPLVEAAITLLKAANR